MVVAVEMVEDDLLLLLLLAMFVAIMMMICCCQGSGRRGEALILCLLPVCVYGWLFVCV